MLKPGDVFLDFVSLHVGYEASGVQGRSRTVEFGFRFRFIQAND